MELSKNTLIVKISFWGVVLGELISLAHSLGMDKGTLFHGNVGKYGINYILQLCGQIPEQLGNWISFIFCSILWMYVMEVMRRHKIYLFTSISLLIALDGLMYLLAFFISGNVVGDVGTGLLLFIFLVDMATMGYLAVVLIAKADDMRAAGFLLGAQVLLMGVDIALAATDNESYGSWLLALIGMYCQLSLLLLHQGRMLRGFGERVCKDIATTLRAVGLHRIDNANAPVFRSTLK